ncbi:cytochrome P450 monooxygenase [Pleurotus pulmonarius]
MIPHIYDVARAALSDPIIVLLLGAFVVLWSTRSSSGYKRIPGPRGLPLIGNLLQWPTSKPWLVFDKWHKEYQSDIISVNLAGLKIVVLGSMKRATDLHEKRSALYANRPHMTALVEIMNFEDCLFAFHQYGPQWRLHRKLFNDHFQAHAIPRYHPSMIREAHILAQQVLRAPEKILQHLRHVYPAILVDVTYGFRLAPDDNYFVSLAEEAMAGLSVSFFFFF